MTGKTKKKTSKKCSSNEFNLETIIVELFKTGITSAKWGVELLEGLAKKNDIHKKYPYLNHAFANVKNVISFFTLKNETKPESKKHERKKSYKKISKQKTLRHGR